ncbi:MAG: 16S rRNA (adenine(1518)-N(6)/adenine(1519)-N(6))-dimethyltransferase RsmA [Myxococcota bacterium]
MDNRSPKSILREHGLRPKKSWSQNFLSDARVTRAIADAVAGTAGGRTVLELGAGTGALTRELASRCTRVLALERDRELAVILREEFRTTGNVTVVEDNALTVDVTALAGGSRLVVAGNLPYHIASQIVFHLLDQRASISSFFVMMQREMADRIVSPPGRKDYGVISVLCALHTRAALVIKVPPGAFHPRPRVDSAVVRFDVLEAPAVPVRDEAAFVRVVKAAFNQRRKTLRNALKPVFPDQASMDSALAASGVDGGRRGETLSLHEFAKVSDHV